MGGDDSRLAALQSGGTGIRARVRVRSAAENPKGCQARYIEVDTQMLSADAVLALLQSMSILRAVATKV